MWTWITAKMELYAGLAGALILAVGYAFLKGRSAGKTAVTSEIAKETHELDTKFSKIDAARPDFERSVSSLRDRASKP